IAETESLRPDANVQQAIRNLLVRIGSDDFAQIRRTPPLVYHNDLSASVKRFYWSEDFGYALWLRLYEASGVNAEQVQQRSPSPLKPLFNLTCARSNTSPPREALRCWHCKPLRFSVFLLVASARGAPA